MTNCKVTDSVMTVMYFGCTIVLVGIVIG